MDRFVPLSATTSTLGAHLGPDEEIVTLQEHVGLYHGAHKAKRQPNGTVYLSSHRIIYVDALAPLYHSCALSLALVRQTEYYAGFLKSSPKITLRLEPPPASVLAQQNAPTRPKKPAAQTATSSSSSTGSGAGARGAKTGTAAASAVPKSWICPVCGYSNSDAEQCALCGVSYHKSSSTRPARTSLGAGTALTSSTSPILPSNTASPLPLSTDASSRSARPTDPIACPACTFLNHPSMATCELCNTPLQGEHSAKTLNRHASTPALPNEHASSATRARTTSTSAGASPRQGYDSDEDSEEDADEAQTDGDDPTHRFPAPDSAIEYVKLSFRKGGDKAFYELLKTTLRQRAWAVSHAPPGAQQSQNQDSTLPVSTSTSSISPASMVNTRRTAASSPSVPPIAPTTIDIDGRRVPLSLLHRDPHAFPGSMSGHHSSGSTSQARLGAGAASAGGTSAAGIEAILRNTSLTHSQASTTMLSALEDLEALQKRAQSMVELAEKLNAQLTRLEKDAAAKAGGGVGGSVSTTAGEGANASIDRESATLIRSSLVMLGLPSPAVTEDMVAERGIYELELARELAGLLLSNDTLALAQGRNGAPNSSRAGGGLMGVGKVLSKGKERSLSEVADLERVEDELRLLSSSNAAALIELVEDRIQRARLGRGADDAEDQDEEAQLERVLAESSSSDASTAAARELVGLDEVWCVWNRARGVALLPPADLRACAVHLPRLTEPPIRLRVFPPPAGPSSSSGKKAAASRSPTGLCMLHTPRYSESAFEARVLARLRFLAKAAASSTSSRSIATSGPIAKVPSSTSSYAPGISAFELAARERAPVVLIEQMLSGLEMGSQASLVRDDGGLSSGGSGTKVARAGGQVDKGAHSAPAAGSRTGGGGGGPNTRWYENEFGRAWESVRAYRADCIKSAQLAMPL